MENDGSRDDHGEKWISKALGMIMMAVGGSKIRHG